MYLTILLPLKNYFILIPLLGPPLTQPSDTSPFRPPTGQISTMRPTVQSQLSDALDEVSLHN